MRVSLEPTVRDARPPKVVMRIVNPLMHLVLRTPLSRLIRPLALIVFEGRRSGSRRSIVVGWHMLDGSPIVVTPAAWRTNFADPRLATVRWRGRVSSWVGRLETDPNVVAGVVDQMLRGGTSAPSLALRVPPGHTVTSADIVETCRAIIRFTPSTRT